MLWTDVFQVCIMVAGLLAVIIQGSIKLGGLREAWKIAESRDRIDFWKYVYCLSFPFQFVHYDDNYEH